MEEHSISEISKMPSDTLEAMKESFEGTNVRNKELLLFLLKNDQSQDLRFVEIDEKEARHAEAHTYAVHITEWDAKQRKFTSYDSDHRPIYTERSRFAVSINSKDGGCVWGTYSTDTQDTVDLRMHYWPPDGRYELDEDRYILPPDAFEDRLKNVVEFKRLTKTLSKVYADGMLPRVRSIIGTTSPEMAAQVKALFPETELTKTQSKVKNHDLTALRIPMSFPKKPQTN